MDYAATDSFFVVIPPRSTGHTQQMVVTLVPRTATIGTEVQPLDPAAAVPTTGTALSTSQQNRPLTRPAPCDFGSEINCVGEVVPGIPIDVALDLQPSNPTRVTLAVSWA
jgi:hypothetical protein